MSALHMPEIDPVEVAICACADAWNAFGQAKAAEMALEDERPLIKALATQRIMQTTNPLTNKAHSASSAEAVVEQDQEYLGHRLFQRLAVIETQRCYGLAKAAEFRAQRIAQGERR